MGCGGSVATAASSIKETRSSRVSRATSPIDFERICPVQPTVEVPTKQESRDVLTQTERVELESSSVTPSTTTATATAKPNATVPNITPIETLVDRELAPSNPRLSANPKAYNTQWVLSGLDAQHYLIGISREFLSMGPSVIRDAVAAMKRADDLRNLPPSIWDLFDLAAQKDDAIFLIQAYTMDSDFYKILNRSLASHGEECTSNMDQGERLRAMMGESLAAFTNAMNILQAYQAGQSMAVPNNTETDWARLYLKSLLRLLAIPNAKLRYRGPVYRGLWLSREDADWYRDKNNGIICNKAITSTSKSKAVAQSFIDAICPASADMIQTIFTYVIQADCAVYALDVSEYSLLPIEEEVLLLPGVSWIVTNIEFDRYGSMEIELSSTMQILASMLGSNPSAMSCPVQ